VFEERDFFIINTVSCGSLIVSCAAGLSRNNPTMHPSFPQRSKVFLICFAAIICLLLLRCKVAKSCHDFIYGYLNPATKKSVQSVQNEISYVYVVGVEGVGHHGVVPAIAAIGEACEHYIVYEHKLLRSYQYKHQSQDFRSILEVSKHVRAPAPQVLVVEDASFPSGKDLRVGSYAQKKAHGKYDLEWIYDEIHAVGEIGVKFLFVSRDFYRTVASHPEFDNGFEAHAQVLHDYAWYIHQEYQRIESKEPGLWRQIAYEWFTEMKNCPALVKEVAQFLDLGTCNIELACQKLASVVRKESVKTVNATERAIAMSFNVSVPIPYLPY
jgi:hypothetical protein